MNCPDCGIEITKPVKSCPNCGETRGLVWTNPDETAPDKLEDASAMEEGEPGPAYVGKVPGRSGLRTATDLSLTILCLYLGQLAASFAYGLFYSISGGKDGATIAEMVKAPEAAQNFMLILNVQLSCAVGGIALATARGSHALARPVVHCMIAGILLDIADRTIPFVHAVVWPGTAVYMGFLGGALSIPYRFWRERKASP